MWSSSLLVLPDQSRVWVDTERAVVEFTDTKGKCLMTLLFIVPRVSGGICTCVCTVRVHLSNTFTDCYSVIIDVVHKASPIGSVTMSTSPKQSVRK